MSTKDVPGANPAHKDELASGCWAEHDDGSLLFVKGTEQQQVVYELYDLAQDPAVSYQDAMREDDFKSSFSFPPVGQSAEKWKWHDKTPFPWSSVMKTFDKPRPVYADVHDQLSAATRVAKSLRLRGQKVAAESVEHMTDREMPLTHGIVDRLKRALDAFVG